MADKGFKKFDVNQLVEFGKQAGFTDCSVVDIVNGKSYAVVYRK